MTPKEKAQELVLKYYTIIYHSIHQQQKAKQCALIAVDEILQQILWDKAAVKYWNEVKQEIEKL